MSVQTVTDALMTDSTGQQIVEAIQDLAASQSPEAKNVSQTAIPGVTNVDDALSHLKDEIESSQGGDVKTVNNIEPDENGDIHIDEIQFAKQLVTEDAQQSSGTYIERTTGGDASLSDGDAQLIAIFGRSVKSGYVAEVLNLTVDAVEREVPEGITATLDTETFIAYITPEEEQESGEEEREPGEEEEEVISDLSGTYSTEYNGSAWSVDPGEMGLTVSGTPASGDSITVYYDGENDPSITMVYCPRYADPEITAVIDRDTFVAYVNASGTITLTYDSGWSVAPSLYGVTVTGKPVDGDEITIGYVKEDRGVIAHANPTAFKSTGWNLYNNANGYARVLKYGELYGFIIGGTYTAVQFSETLSGEKTTITPVDGHFGISSDGYVWVTGGNATDTYIVMEWSDWTDGPEGDFKAYSESVVDLSSAMANFPYGLMQVGSVYDEINLNMGYAYSRVNRLTYSTANLAYANATGLKYEVDRDYIYIPRETVETYSISIDGGHTACDHGMEIITGTTIPVFVQTLYGNNLVDKLRRDVLTLSQQTLTDAQKNQVCQNLGINRGTLRKVALAIAVSDWVAITGGFKATFSSSYLTTTCDWSVTYDGSYRTYAKKDFIVDLKFGGGALEFVTTTKPTGIVTGIIRIFDNDDGKLPIVHQGTASSIENGGTGQNSLAGIRSSFGIGDLSALQTSAKTSLVDAVNEQNQALSNYMPTQNITNDILTDALTVTGTKVFIGNGSSYTGNDLPSTDFRYAVFVVFKRSSTIYHVVGYYGNQIALNRYNSTAWEGWSLWKDTFNGEATQLSATNVTSDTFLLTLKNGIYKLTGTKSNYLPIRYGVLIKFGSGTTSPYITCLAMSTYVSGASSSNVGGIWFRVGYPSENKWYYDWQEIGSTANTISLSNEHNSSETKITDMDMVGVNLMGRSRFDSSVSPISSDISANYISFGPSEDNKTILLGRVGNNIQEYYGNSYDSSYGWQGWQQFVTSKNLLFTSVNDETAHDITIPNSTNCVIFASAVSASNYGWAGIVTANGEGTIAYLEIVKGANITISTSKNTLTITTPVSITLKIAKLSLN